MSAFRQGHIIWAVAIDQYGGNPKDRPMVVLTKTSEISDDQPFVTAAITTTFDYPIAPNQVELPASPGGHATTGLKERCVAVCDWLLAVETKNVRRIGGILPEYTLKRILHIVNGLSQ